MENGLRNRINRCHIFKCDDEGFIFVIDLSRVYGGIISFAYEIEIITDENLNFMEATVVTSEDKYIFYEILKEFEFYHRGVFSNAIKLLKDEKTQLELEKWGVVVLDF